MIDLLIKNKKMLKTIRISLPRFYSVILSLSFFGAIITPSLVYADQYTQQIQALQVQNSQVNQNLSVLENQASTYQQEINNLQIQISALQSQIADTQNQINTIQAEIVANQALLVQEKNTLANILQSMYVDGHMTTLESLATSNDISDFVTKVEYQNIVQQQIQSGLTKINQTQTTLNQQNVTLSRTLASQQTENSQLASEQSQQGNLLAMDQQQQTAYTQQLQTNNTQLAQLEAEEAALIARDEAGGTIISGNCGTSNDTYPEPWCSSGPDSTFDSWGMYNRECVSYAAWMVASTGKYMPKWGYEGEGNAYQWINDAEAAGYSVSRTPQAGDVAILPATSGSPLGHAMYVMGVNSNGTINVSEYNAKVAYGFDEALNINPAYYYYINFPSAG
ncbi:MAG TPA: CHAP domain-containing protein [Candidatus Saccharimonadales bacterium]